MISTLIQVALGGAIGSVLRYLTVLGAGRWLGAGFPYGVLIVNVAGSFVIGVLFVALAGREVIVYPSPDVADGVRVQRREV